MYDVITMFHVHYYWTTPNKRIEVMKKLMNHLNPKQGMLFILILDQGLDNQIQLRNVTKAKLKFRNNRHYQSGPVLADQVANQEMREMVLKSYETVKIIEKPYDISLNFDLSGNNDLTNQLISYVLSVNFESLSLKMREFVISWIKDNCLKIDSKRKNQLYQMRQSVRMLLYTLNNI